MTSPTADPSPAPGRGRQARAERRIEQILDAAVQVFGSVGPSALTHRAVAAAAGVPLGSMTYYFDDREDLIRRTMQRAIDVERMRLTALVPDGDGEQTVQSCVVLLTRMFLEKPVSDPLYDVALFEMFLEATRNPSVRTMTTAWSEMIAGLIDRVLPPTGPGLPRDQVVQIVAALIDGLMLEEMSNGSLGLERLADRVRVVVERFTV